MIQDNADVEHKYMKMYCDTNQFPALPFYVSHPKPHGGRGLSKHYHLRFYPKLGHVIYKIIRITCACVVCTSMLDKTWVSGIPFKENRNATNLLPTLLIGQFWDHIIIGILLRCHQNHHLLRRLMR